MRCHFILLIEKSKARKKYCLNIIIFDYNFFDLYTTVLCKFLALLHFSFVIIANSSMYATKIFREHLSARAGSHEQPIPLVMAMSYGR